MEQSIINRAKRYNVKGVDMALQEMLTTPRSGFVSIKDLIKKTMQPMSINFYDNKIVVENDTYINEKLNDLTNKKLWRKMVTKII